MSRLLSLAVLFFGAGMAIATCPPAVKKIFVEQQTAVPVLAVPSYGSSYNASDDIMRKILETLERIEAKLDGQALRNVTFESVIANKCASCHVAGKPSGFILIGADGKLAPLSVEQKNLIKILIKTTDTNISMPKNGKLTDAERTALLSGLGQ